MAKSPVFIVGSPRSGTSILATALSTVGYHGYREGNFLPLMQVICKTIDNHFAVAAKPNPHVLVAQIEPVPLKAGIENMFKEIVDDLNPVGPWFDKSGNHEMIWAIPAVRRMWPNSVFIFAKRRAIENIVSRVRKFPTRSFEYHCLDWARNMAAWRTIRAQLPPEVRLEVDQQDLIRDTETTSRRICDFLGIGATESQTLVQLFRSRRPQETRKGSASEILSLDQAGWSTEQLATFQKFCATEMEAFGYGTDVNYSLNV